MNRVSDLLEKWKKETSDLSIVEDASSNVGVISFGRMNPVTTGHEKLAKAVLSAAKKYNGTPMIFLSHSNDPKKNPLTYEQKIDLAKKAFGSKIIIESPSRTILEVAAELQGKFQNLIVVAGSDRIKEFDTLLNKYNNNLYEYDSIKVVSAGERDPDASDVTGMSASKMRQLAKENDLSSFKNGLPRKLQAQAEKIMKMVRSGMGVNESHKLFGKKPLTFKEFVIEKFKII